MGLFEEKSAQLANFISQYESASAILNEMYTLYATHRANDTLVSYLAPVLSINLIATGEYAQDCYEYYIRIKNDGTLTKEEKQQLIEQFKPFKDKCKADQINYKQPRDRAVLYANQTDLPFNLPDTINRLDLNARYLNGVNKMCASLLGQRYASKVTIDYSNSGGTMNQYGAFTIDANMLDQSPVLNLHISTHEYGHYFSNWFSGASLRSDGVRLPGVKLLMPSYIRSSQTASQKEEALADYFAAVASAIFKIPPSVIYTRFYSFAVLPSGASHPAGSVRSELIQSASSILGHHIDRDQFKNNRWAEMAERIQAMPNITFKQLPNKADFDKILSNFPNNRTRQIEALAQNSPTLFTLPSWGEAPPPAMVTSDLLQQLASITNPNIPLNRNNRGIVPTITIPQLQASWDRSRQTPPTPRVAPINPLPAPAPTFARAPWPPLPPRIPFPKGPRAAVNPAQPIVFSGKNRPRRGLLTYIDPQQQMRSSPIKGAPLIKYHIDTRANAAPFVFSQANTAGNELGHTEAPPTTVLPSNQGVMTLHRGLGNNAGIAVMTQNLMLGKALIQMAKNGIQWLSPSWTYTLPVAKTQRQDAPANVNPEKTAPKMGV